MNVPDHLIFMESLRLPMSVKVGFAFEESATTAENRVIADVTQVVP